MRKSKEQLINEINKMCDELDRKFYVPSINESYNHILYQYSYVKSWYDYTRNEEAEMELDEYLESRNA